MNDKSDELNDGRRADASRLMMVVRHQYYYYDDEYKTVRSILTGSSTKKK
jgi:hypothetical protein